MYNDYGSDYGAYAGGIVGGILIFAIIFFIIFAAIAVVQIIAQWKIFKKAGKNGWEAIIPFYCNWVLVEISGLKWYWFLFFFAPMVFDFFGLGIIGWLAYLFGTFNIFYNISKKFGKDTGFAVCLTLFTPICMAILGFSKKAVYDTNVVVSENGLFDTPVGNNNNNTQNKYEQSTTQNIQSTELSTAKFCTNCGNKLTQSAKFCTNCGKKI